MEPRSKKSIDLQRYRDKTTSNPDSPPPPPASVKKMVFNIPQKLYTLNLISFCCSFNKASKVKTFRYDNAKYINI